jgi:hypothetical protein
MWPGWKVERALELAEEGLNNCEISRELGIHRRTISDWVSGRTRTGSRKEYSRRSRCMRCPEKPLDPFPGLTAFSCAYLLGLYLGDGWIAKHRREVFRLRIYLDRRYPLIVAECEAAVSIVMPESRTAVYRRRNVNLDEVGSYSKHWPHLFPQHGTGRKHERRIALEPWQERIVDRHPGRLLRGLIHSDGCRVTNRIRHPKRTYTYPRYFFSNRSLDIQRIFCEACDRLGIAWRQDGPWNISVARRDAVAIMDRHVGPKR